MKRNELGRLCLALGFIGGMFMQVEARETKAKDSHTVSRRHGETKMQKLELTWVGKNQKIAVEPRILIEVREKSNLGGGTEAAQHDTENLLIHGDNLLALKSLEQKFAGKVRCIYIDPPYNTGSAFEHYDDNLEHSQWLNLMRPRLEILWKLLAPDGSIWISIDDAEYAYLKVLCDELYGRANFVATIVWQQRTTRENRKVFSANCEYVLVYARNQQRFSETRNALPLTDEIRARYKNPDNDPRGPWQSVSINAQGGHGTASQFYDLVAPNGKVHKLPKGRCWLYTQQKFAEEVAKNNIWFGSDGNGAPRKKKFLSEVTVGVTPETLWLADFAGTNDQAKKEIHALLTEAESFDTPKPEQLVMRILTIASNPGDLVLDSFLGSGTTCAVAHKMGRKWIGIEMGDHAYTHCKVRMDKVIAGTDEGGVTKQTGWTKGGGYRFYELAPSLVKFDAFGEAVINAQYNADMLAAGMALQEGFIYEPDGATYWKQAHAKGSTTSWLYTTTRHVGRDYLASLAGELKGGEFLEIACTSFDAKAAKDYPRITMRKIPESILKRCEFDRDSYAFNIVNAPDAEEEDQ